MKTYKEYLTGYYNALYQDDSDWNTIVSEALITFGGKAYPKFGQIVIVAGGSGSGKGFVIDNLFGISGKRYDVDYLKNEVKKNKEIRKRLSEKYNVDEKIFDMTTSQDVSKVHELMKVSGLKQQYENNIFTMARNAPEDKKPNLIFDKTCNSLLAILSIVNICIEHGYKPENIHLVWVLNDIHTAIQQNSERDRKVDELLLKSIHREVAHTMKGFIENFDDWLVNLNGDIYVCFNKRDVDTKSKKLNNGFYIEDANYIKIKSAGDKNINIPNNTLEKIREYTPDGTWA